MGSVFEVLAEPRRRQILDLVVDSERSVGELVDLLGMSQPSVSKRLRDEGLLEVTDRLERHLDEMTGQPTDEQGGQR